MASTMKEIRTRKSTAPAKRARVAVANPVRHATKEEIALRAQEIYEKSGCPGGRDLEFWLEAERQLREGLDGQ